MRPETRGRRGYRWPTSRGSCGVGLSIRKELLRRRGVIATGRVRPPALKLPEQLIPLLEKHLATLPAITATH
ncbi:hypothetical protein [Mycobacterium sp. ITM-2016-00318]|uniref:hypothetical protein n=1 Tax=Mycobacterium sp. ITM-2016-00318 TaxID=2099693 RepID=UPI0018EACC23|nr:hypothetical protein [Mycobacterium sp. ITM-2016-00318]WNG90591.1 hypothetical protein C6A82_013495 [Mycobacterium sp. ITM-2016-00318]